MERFLLHGVAMRMQQVKHMLSMQPSTWHIVLLLHTVNPHLMLLIGSWKLRLKQNDI